MPKDTQTHGLAKKWRRLQNELQMILHDHPVNEARLERGELSINSVWLYGCGSSKDIAPHPILNNVHQIYSNHNLGSRLDPRITPLSLDHFIPASNQHHFIFAQDLKLSQWENYWNKSVEAFHKKVIGEINLYRFRQGKLQRHVLYPEEFQLGFFKKLLNQNKKLFPSWVEYAKKIHWTEHNQ
jgi:hypothetical protein